MKNYFLLLLTLLIFSTVALQAQQEKFTYLTDKRFKNAEDLFGYTFVPGTMEITTPGQKSAGEQIEISAGSYKFGITRGNLFVKGEDIDGIHNINQINTTDYGYQLILMNARDPKLQGHLKIIMLKKFVDALVFKADNHAKEMIFLLPEIDKELQESEKKFFTDKNEIIIEAEEDIWGVEVNPFFKTFMPKRVYQRLQKKDAVKISFIETEKIIEKGKKKTDDVVMVIKEETPKVEVEEIVEPTPEPVAVEEKEDEDDGMPSYFKVKKKKPVVEEITEEIVEEVVEEVFEEPTEDLFADESELAEARNDKTEDKKGKKEKKDKKVKIVMEYEVLINDFILNEDGTHEPIERRLNVKNWKMRQDESASNPNEVYQIELETNKGPVYVYLSASKKITKVDCGEVVYLMRGL